MVLRSTCCKTTKPFITKQRSIMSLYAKWMSLPVKVRFYIGVSTMGVALLGGYITTRLATEVEARKELDELDKARLSTNEK